MTDVAGFESRTSIDARVIGIRRTKHYAGIAVGITPLLDAMALGSAGM